MNLKSQFLTLILAASCLPSFSQDKLYKKNGDMLEVRVTEITTRIVSYKKASNPEGPSYTINKDDVSKIVYENGTEDYFGNMNAVRKNNNKHYGNNILSAIPMAITSGVGVGLSYERVLDKQGILSFYIPATVAFINTTTDPITGSTVNNNNSSTYYIMPGLKFYPTGGKGVVRYAVGPNLVYITGKQYVNDFIYDKMGNIIGQDIGYKQRSALGIMVTNSLNINPTDRIHLGLELGLGFTYFNKVNNRNTDTDMLGQFGFKIGYRF